VRSTNYLILVLIITLEPDTHDMWLDIAMRVTGSTDVAVWENDHNTMLQDVAANQRNRNE
jgi:hypothetical protein